MTRILAALLLATLSFAASADIYTATYGVAKVFPFWLYNADGTLDVDEADAGTEVALSCNQGAETTATNDFADEGTHYSISLTAAELQCQTVVVVVNATVVGGFIIETIGHASAFMPSIEANVGTITDGAIVAADFASGAITATVIAADAIGASEIAADAIGAAEVANATIDAATFASAAIDATAIATDAIGAAELAADAVGASEIATDAIGAAELASNAIAAAEIADGAVDNATFLCTGGSFPILGVTDCGTAQSADADEFVLRSAAAFADNEVIGQTLLIASGTTGVGQSISVADNTSTSDTLNIGAWPATTPTGTLTYYLFGTAASTGGSGLDAAGVRAAVGLASANLDTQLTAIDDAVDTEVAAILVDTGTTLDDLVDDLESRLGTPSNLGGGATVAFNLSDIEGQTDDIGVAGAGLTATDDAIMTRLGAPVGASISADIASVKTDTGTTIPAAVAVIDGIVDLLLIGVNVEKINTSDVCGDGSSGDKWSGCP